MACILWDNKSWTRHFLRIETIYVLVSCCGGLLNSVSQRVCVSICLQALIVMPQPIISEWPPLRPINLSSACSRPTELAQSFSPHVPSPQSIAGGREGSKAETSNAWLVHCHFREEYSFFLFLNTAKGMYVSGLVPCSLLSAVCCSGWSVGC